MDRRDKNDEKRYYKRWKGKRTKCKDIVTSKEVNELEGTVEAFKVGYDYFGENVGTQHVYPEYPSRVRSAMRESELKRLERERQERDIEHERRLATLLSQDATRRRAELVNSRVVDVACRKCGHSHRFLFTLEARRSLAGKRFVCTKCGERSAPFLPAA